ncbi:hypothetical protein VOLCADRAFT_107157 [Volvox carteri f. nagariensis]|uniref:HNH nuclease domain-containing protein n=1 Tax=Volvox carteri f. nagariensis TaxID=3068 RepID=D8UC87_VOLCA|nr:uncharacterized protein VOLCADRAFT_107157 [Volvox carteri f. nagariensis]EFJ42657.1 hypothetical protein VOLCADRAFT_107157 [Volvox carteri f. nagariensis]|eukprot:XP_002956308.1 hypothetical protein VOLCADRAFT_107157 [Volvox carteri f. nagariensis]
MTPDDRQRMCAAVTEAGLDSAGLDEEDLELLWAAKYRTAARLRAATRENLVQARLAPGVVDAIRQALGAAAGPGPGSTAADVALADLQRKVSKMESVMPFLVSKVLLWHDGSTAMHSKPEKDRKTSALKLQLQCAGVKGCQLLGEGIPPNCVSLAHLCKLSWADGTCRLLGLSKEDVSSPRNALLLSKPIERAYDNLAVCFYEDPADKKLKLHILWDELKSQKLADCQWLGGPNGKGYAELTNAFGDTTYGDLEAQPLQYYSSTVVPFRRVLSTHAQLSLDRAQRDGKMAGSWTFQDYRSIDNVLTWLQTAELQEPPIAGSVSELSEVMSMSSAPAALDYHALQRVPPALQPNSQACGTVCTHSQLMETGRSFPDACALNCQLPLARLPTITNCPCAPLQSGTFRAGPPYNYLLTLAQLPTATLPPVRVGDCIDW